MSDYKKYRESHLKAQKKYDDKNREKIREKKREYDKKRWQKHKQLQNNWNELKKWLEENKHFYNITGEDLEEDTTITEVLNKMQELEGNNE